MQRIAINRDTARACLGRDLMEEAVLHTFKDGSQAYIRPITPADMQLGQKWAVVKKGDPSKGVPDEVDNLRMGVAVAMQLVVDETGKPIYVLADLNALLKSPRGQELAILASSAMTEASRLGNESPKLTEEELPPQQSIEPI